MSRIAWRIASDTRDHEADDLTGAGAKQAGGRWNEVDLAAVYGSETQALACLETIVHLNAGGLPLNRYLVRLVIPDRVWASAHTAPPAGLPVGWDAEPAGRVSVQFGTTWLRARTSAVLRVPYVIVPDEFNIVINPQHRDSAGIAAAKLRKWLYDPRIRNKPGR